MNNFGFNLLSTVQTVIGTQDYQIEQWLSRAQNARAIEVDTYSEAEPRNASIQPVDSKEANLQGLQMDQTHVKIYDVDLIGILKRSENPPRIIWDGYYWTPVSPKAKWNDWNKVYCARQRVVE